MFRSYSRCTTLILFDLQIGISLLVFVYHPRLNALLAEKIGVPFLVAVTVGMAIILLIGIDREKKCCIYLWSGFVFLEPIYIGLKCVHLGLQWDAGIDQMSAGVVFAIAAIAIVVRGLLAYYVDCCYKNFDRGLKERGYTPWSTCFCAIYV
ncbi:uncharacterized protein LOC134180636 [Corticium candelabrum]|uniref:uncharacterized protein LOC134180636 n=1 Tax=Corticium candelabrum TaxID=121492 RepID=UPI002E25B902|nr:uncharacterized protein LOC134180636 [Corticium candelabrum]